MSEEDTHQSLHSWLLRLLPVGAVVASVAFLLGAFVLISDIKRGHEQRDRICRVAQRDNFTLRSLLLLASSNSRVTLKNEPARLHEAQLFYREALGLLPPIDCRKL